MFTRHVTRLCSFGLFFLLGIVFGTLVLRDHAPAKAGGATSCIPGDLNDDGGFDLSDAVFALNHLFVQGPAPTPCIVSASDTKIVAVIRHAEKDVGIDPSLTEEGRARAEHLADLFEDFPLTQLIASDLKRTQETLAPLAARKSMEVKITAALANAEEVTACLQALPTGSFSIVAHHSFTIPNLLRGVGAIGEGEFVTVSGFDQFWLVIFRGTDTPEVVELRY